ncbi:MAG: YigZ family protein [Ignavibacteria bacterium]|nr:YigZ family protein [Ignavibacteria bacterium]
MNSYLTVEKIFQAEILVKNSKFIAYLVPINSKEEFLVEQNKLRKEHQKAAHICYAYILDEKTFHYSDDGEPNGTAGLRIYLALKFKNLIKCALFVVRYFGGIKLGVGSLAKTYFEVSMKVLNEAEIVKNYLTKEITLTLNYDVFEKIKRKLTQLSVYEPVLTFAEKVEMKIFVEIDKLHEVTAAIRELKIDNFSMK